MVLMYARRGDQTIIDIIRWLIFYSKKFARIECFEDIDNSSLNINYDLDNKASTSQDLSFFYHGNYFALPHDNMENKLKDWMLNLYQVVFQNITNESKVFGCSEIDASLNKLNVLEIAKNIGFTIPKTAIVSTKQKLIEYKAKWDRVITKNLGQNLNISSEGYLVNGLQTIELTNVIINKINNSFSPSLIQQLNPKLYEIRVFYFNNRIKSIAIFSQSSTVSQVDGRQIDLNKPTRHVPYLISEKLSCRIKMLMEKLKLNYGSLDFICGLDNQIYFLEVNQYGQFGYLSKAGNFQLEKMIAEYL